MRSVATALLAAALAVPAGALVACGGDSSEKPATRSQRPTQPSSGSEDREMLAAVRAATRATAADFPPTAGRTLQQIADTTKTGPKAGLATGVLLPRTERLAFGVLDADNRFLYGQTAVYVARRPDARARGPYPAPGDPFTVAARFQSPHGARDTANVKLIYSARVPFPQPGRYAVLTVTRTPRGLAGAPTQVTVLRRSPIPDIGERPPAVHTDTIKSAGGDLDAIDTRQPHAPDLHRVDFKRVLGKRPVALLFATPALCESRTCGPVTDIAVQLQHEFGDRMAFIHQEVYVDNQPSKGLRSPLRAFDLQSEPWLFTFTREGRVAARLEGAFGIRAFRRAVRAALR
jgi:hypothetical protein